MRKLSLLFLFLTTLLSTSPVSSQNIDKFYIQSPHKDGLLYFVFPQKMSVQKEAEYICKKPLSYDYTYLDANDSVTVLMTLFTSEAFIPEQIHISINNGSTVIDRNTEMLFTEPEKGNWKIRIKTNISLEEWTNIYQSSISTPPIFSFSAQGKTFIPSYQDNSKRWKKVSSKFRRLLKLITINRK